MFTHQLSKSKELFSVEFDEHAKRHFLKRFEKDYKGKSWKMTLDAIVDDLVHLRHGDYDLQRTQQVDELWSDGETWVFKYDFRVAQTKVSAKAAGNRVVGILNRNTNRIKIVLIYNKTDLPKKMSETQYIKNTIKEIYSEITWE